MEARLTAPPIPAAADAALTEDEKLEIENRFRRDIAAGRRRRLRRGLLLNLVGVLIFLAVWEALPRLVPGVNTQMFPPPSGVVMTLVGMMTDGSLAAHAWSSLKRVAAGFVIGSTAGILVGLLTGRLAMAQSLSDPVLHGLRSIPAIAFVPLAIVWFGLGETPKVALISWGTFFPVWISTFIGVRDVPKLYVQSALSLGASPLNIMFRVVLPAALPFVFAGLRHATAVAFVIVVAAELVGASSGLGYLISFSHLVFRIDMMFVGLLALGALGFLADAAFAALLQRVFPWYRSERNG
ncbi:ABC transporter permease [Bosea sp. 117]|uniref:ABC transporter permease n=1 Tax=Bosea sp. 117 TaxID=1125973 RepID=UPI00068BFF31|nr:ABC transporter permease [Bosea sp. 117]